MSTFHHCRKRALTGYYRLLSQIYRLLVVLLAVRENAHHTGERAPKSTQKSAIFGADSCEIAVKKTVYTNSTTCEYRSMFPGQ